VEFLERETPKFISPLRWPPNSPDLYSVDYSVWSILQEKVYKTHITDLDDLKRRIRIRTEWAKLRHVIIAAAVRQWRRRLSACVKASSGHFEHCFNSNIVLLQLLQHLKPSFTSRIEQLIFRSDFLQLSVMTLCVLIMTVV